MREAAEETPVAVVHDGATYAVMMATPADLEDFAVGFSLTEGVIASPADVRGLEIVEGDLGIEARLWLEPGRGAALAGRRRRLAGATGCGLCGVESLQVALQAPRRALEPLATLDPKDILAAMAALGPAQPLGARTRAMHAAALWRPGSGIVALREDVGRHNALDKLVGALARAGEAADGVVLLSSRVSVEMVQKTLACGAPALAAVSAPTALAVRIAREAGLTLIAVARDDGFEVFSGEARLAL